MTEQLQAFLDLVDCRADEVRDVPTDRLNIDPATVNADAHYRSIGEKEIYFGKHKGMKLKDIPRAYLEWLVDTESTSRDFRRFQRHAREFLAATADDTDANHLDAEFQRIVR